MEADLRLINIVYSPQEIINIKFIFHQNPKRVSEILLIERKLFVLNFKYNLKKSFLQTHDNSFTIQ